MDMKSKTATTKTAGFPNTDASQTIREIAKMALNKPKKLTRK